MRAARIWSLMRTVLLDAPPRGIRPWRVASQLILAFSLLAPLASPHGARGEVQGREFHGRASSWIDLMFDVERAGDVMLTIYVRAQPSRLRVAAAWLLDETRSPRRRAALASWTRPGAHAGVRVRAADATVEVEAFEDVPSSGGQGFGWQVPFAGAGRFHLVAVVAAEGHFEFDAKIEGDLTLRSYRSGPARLYTADDFDGLAVLNADVAGYEVKVLRRAGLELEVGGDLFGWYAGVTHVGRLALSYRSGQFAGEGASSYFFCGRNDPPVCEASEGHSYVFAADGVGVDSQVWVAVADVPRNY